MDLPKVGDIIDGTYEIKDLLGQGGFGAVFMARHIPMDRDVAFKMLTTTTGAKPGEMAERFRREVMAIRNLSHPNTVRIFDFREHDNGMLYYTMEHLRGVTLKDLIKLDGPQPPARVKRIIKQILKSLSEAHSFGIVHRDLKPANIMLVEMHGEHDFVKVLDFGIAKLLDQNPEGDDEEDPLTSAGMLVGTLRYMAPEQITGVQLGPHTDLYALALIMIELLTGTSVFAGSGRWEILQQQISEERVAIPTQLHTLPLFPVIARALEKRPQDRYSSAEDMVQALDKISDGLLEQIPPLGKGVATFDVPSIGVVQGRALGDDATPTGHTEALPLDAIIPLQGDEAQRLGVSSDEIYVPEQDADLTQMAPPPEDMAPPSPEFRGPTRLDATEAVSIPKPDTSNNTLAIVAIVLVLLLGGFFVYTQMNPAQPTAPTPPPIATKTTEPKTPTPPPEKPPEPKTPPVEAPKEYKVVVDVPGERAKVYVGDSIVGVTPHVHKFTEPVTLTIKADGKLDHTVTLTETSPAELNLELKRAGRTKNPRRNNPKKDPPKKDPKVDPPKKDPPKGSDWVDIRTPSKKDPKKDPTKVPIF